MGRLPVSSIKLVWSWLFHLGQRVLLLSLFLQGSPVSVCPGYRSQAVLLHHLHLEFLQKAVGCKCRSFPLSWVTTWWLGSLVLTFFFNVSFHVLLIIVFYECYQFCIYYLARFLNFLFTFWPPSLISPTHHPCLWQPPIYVLYLWACFFFFVLVLNSTYKRDHSVFVFLFLI